MRDHITKRPGYRISGNPVTQLTLGGEPVRSP
jgi:hypothetical protein